MARTEQVKSAQIAVAWGVAGDQQVVAAVPGKKIRVLGYVMVVSAAGVNPKWRSAANDRSGAMPLGANGGVSAPVLPEAFGFGWFETAVNEALNLNGAAAGNAGGHVLYQEV